MANKLRNNSAIPEILTILKNCVVISFLGFALFKNERTKVIAMIIFFV